MTFLAGNGYEAEIVPDGENHTGHITQHRPSRLFTATVGAEFLFREIIQDGQYVKALRSIRSEIPRSPVVVDGGANEGLFGVFANAILGGIELVGFEPVIENVPLCQANWDALDFTLYVAALGKETRQETIHLLSRTGSTLYPEERTEWAKTHTATPCTRTVQVVPLDSLNLERLDVLKLDVEGGEQDALEGAVETIRRCRPFILCSYEHHVNDKAWLLSFARAHRFRVFDDEPLRLLTFTP